MTQSTPVLPSVGTYMYIFRVCDTCIYKHLYVYVEITWWWTENRFFHSHE